MALSSNSFCKQKWTCSSFGGGSGTVSGPFKGNEIWVKATIFLGFFVFTWKKNGKTRFVVAAANRWRWVPTRFDNKNERVPRLVVVLEQPRDRSKAAKLEKRKRFFLGRGGGEFFVCFFFTWPNATDRRVSSWANSRWGRGSCLRPRGGPPFAGSRWSRGSTSSAAASIAMAFFLN